jgi:hypothetical protein
MASTDDKTNFYVTKGSAAANTNGGSMNTGNGQTYANDGPTETFANVTSDDSLGGATILLSVMSGGWGTTAVDDFVCWDIAGSPQFLKVLELSYDDDANVIRCDSVSGAVADATKSVNVGGAWLEIDFPLDMIDNSWANAAGNPITIWVKNGSYNEPATIDNAGAALLPITLEGYNTDEGDGWDYDWTGNLPTIDGGGINDYGIRSSLGGDTYWILKHLRVTGSTGAGYFGDVTTDQVRLEHCRGDNNDEWGLQADNTIACIACDWSFNTLGGADADNSFINLGCEVYGNEDIGLSGAGFGVVAHCLLYDNKEENVFFSSSPVLIDNTIDGNFDGGRTVSSGIRISIATASLAAFNIVHNCQKAFEGPGAGTTFIMSYYNQWDNNNLANTGWIPGQGDVERLVVDVSGEYVNLAGNNYQPTAASPANGAAGPTTSPSGLTTTNRAVGAAEPKTNAAGKLVNGGLVCP